MLLTYDMNLSDRIMSDPDHECWYLRGKYKIADSWGAIILFSTTMYLPAIYMLKKFYSSRAPFPHTKIVVLWNFILSSMSFLGSAIILIYQPEIILRRRVDPEDYVVGSRVVISLFCATKFIEYGDTMWLVVKKRPTIFLHIYHHITVTLYCWHALYVMIDYGHIFAFVNLNIHAVMYAYYGLALVFRQNKILKACRPYITLMQLSQMFLGLTLSLMALWDQNPEPGVRENSIMAVVMYISYAYLFSSFFITNYTSYCDINLLVVATLIGATFFGGICSISNILQDGMKKAVLLPALSVVTSGLCMYVALYLNVIAKFLLCIGNLATSQTTSYTTTTTTTTTPEYYLNPGQFDVKVIMNRSKSRINRNKTKSTIAKNSDSESTTAKTKNRVILNVTNPEVDYHTRVVHTMMRYGVLPVLSIMVNYILGGTSAALYFIIGSGWLYSIYGQGGFDFVEEKENREVDIEAEKENLNFKTK